VVSFLVLFVSNALAVTVGEVKDKMGSTFNERLGKTYKVESGYLLEMNDFLQTGEDGAMNIQFLDNTKVTLAPNTEFLIDEFAFDTTVVPIELALNVSINVGTFTYESGEISKLAGDVELITPTASITVQGTAFSGTVTPSGITTITLLPDSSGQVGAVTVSNDAGSQILTQVYTSVTVVSDSLVPRAPSPLDNFEKKNLFDLDSVEDDINDKKDLQFDRKENNEFLENEKEEFESNELLEQETLEIEIDAKEANEIEEQIVSEELTIEADTLTSDATVEVDDFTTQSSELDTSSTQDIVIDDMEVESDVDTSYYDEWEDDLKDWGYIDEDNQISVWDAEGETKMDWDDAKQMYAEMDQAYFDAIGCSDCTWDTVNWDDVNWDDVDWDAYMDEYNDLLEDYGLTSYDTEVEDKSEEVVEEATSTTEGYDWYDFQLNDDYYNNADYIANGGPPTLTIENFCNYNGYGNDWCNQEYVDYLNAWYLDDWKLFKNYTSWTTESKALFKKWYGWCWVSNYAWEFCDGQPAPWDMPSLKDKYIAEWTDQDWNTFYDWTYYWYYYGEYEEDLDDQVSLEEEYAYEDDYDIDAELELWLAEIDNEEDCVNWGYYWDNANSACGTEWVDNSGAETTVTTSGEIINYTTGEITQTTTTTDGITGATSSSTQTGRYTTGGNDDDATASTSGDYTIINRTHGGHTAYVTAETAESADVQIVQDAETQNITLGTDTTKPYITIIQTD